MKRIIQSKKLINEIKDKLGIDSGQIMLDIKSREAWEYQNNANNEEDKAIQANLWEDDEPQIDSSVKVPLNPMDERIPDLKREEIIGSVLKVYPGGLTLKPPARKNQEVAVSQELMALPCAAHCLGIDVRALPKPNGRYALRINLPVSSDLLGQCKRLTELANNHPECFEPFGGVLLLEDE